MSVCKCPHVHSAGEVSRDWYQIFMVELVPVFSCCMMEKRKNCHCPVTSTHMLIPVRGRTAPQIPWNVLAWAHGCRRTQWGLSSVQSVESVTRCAKPVGGLLWRPHVSLQTEQWFCEVHFGKDWPHYPKETAAKAHGLSRLSPGSQHVSCAACCSLGAEERMERREKKWSWMWYGPVTINPAGSGNCHSPWVHPQHWPCTFIVIW